MPAKSAAKKTTKVVAVKKTTKVVAAKRPVGQQMTKSELFLEIAESCEMKKTQVKQLFDKLFEVTARELKKNKEFKLPGFAKFVLKQKAATKARKGINPFTKEEMMFKAKPASKAVRARPMKLLKDAVN